MKAYFASPISDQFNESYGQRGLQPSTGRVTPVRNVSVEYKNDPTVRRGVRTVSGGEMQSDKNATVKYKTLPAQEVPVQTKSDSQEQVAIERKNVARSSRKKRSFNQSQEVVTNNPQGKKTAAARAKGLKNTARAGGATIGIWSWAFFAWLWFQVPMAIISIVFMALTQAIYEFVESLNPTVENRTFIQSGISFVMDVVTWFATKVLDFFGIDITILNPANFFMLTHVIVTLFGWGVLLAIYLIYSLAGTKSVSGTNGGVKMITLLVAMIGYAIPIINLFPWFFIWTLVVLKNPK